MTEKRANEILRTKYPDATMKKGEYFGGSCSGRVVVWFKPDGKCYQYHGCNTYQQVLERLGFTILYKHNVSNYIARLTQLKEELQNGGYENKYHLFDERDFIPLNDTEIKEHKEEIDYIENLLKTSFIE